MPDREKVIRGLEICRHRVISQENCKECPYIYDGRAKQSNCEGVLHWDALELLKEQDAVEPKQVDLYGNDEWWGLVCVCPDCNAEWMTDKANTHFCPNCGRSVKWE